MGNGIWHSVYIYCAGDWRGDGRFRRWVSDAASDQEHHVCGWWNAGRYVGMKKNFYFIYLCVIIPVYDIKREVYPE